MKKSKIWVSVCKKNGLLLLICFLMLATSGFSNSGKDKKIIDSKLEEKIKEKEGEKILKAISPNSFKIALSEYGKEFTSIDFSKFITELQNKGINEVSFIIGSAIGLSETVVKNSDFKLALAKMTLPHQMAQLFLLEQIYRAFKIMNNEPYHK